MTNGVGDEKEPVTDSSKPIITDETTVSTVASILAGMFLEENVRKGREIEIPSLGIIIGKSNLHEPNGSRNLDNGKDKEQPPKNA